MASTEETEVLYKLMKAGAKQATASGAGKLGLPDYVARFLASQLAFTLDLLKKGHRLNGPYLAVLLAEKGIGIAGLAAGHRYDCAISTMLLTASLSKAVGLTAFTGPGHLTLTGLELLSSVYAADKACGVSEAVSNKFYSEAAPAASWLERGVVQWLTRGY